MNKLLFFLALSTLLLGYSGCAVLSINNVSGDTYGASNKVNFRTGGSFGAWGGSLSESFGKLKSTTPIDAAWGGVHYAGLNFGLLFIDWSPSYFGVGKIGTSNATNNAYYLNLLGLEAGFSFYKLTGGIIPVEAFVGIDPIGELGFATGTQSVFDGDAIKIGVNIPLIELSHHWRLGLRSEIRDGFLSLNGASFIPLTVTSWSYYAGVAIMFSR